LNASTSLPRLVLERQAGEHFLGVFSVVASLSGAIGLLYSALAQTALPRLARIFTSDKEKFRVAIGRIMLVAGAAGVAMMFAAWNWGVRAVSLIFGSQSTVTAELVTGLVAVGVLSNTSSLLGAGLTASGRYWSQLRASLMILAVTGAASVWLIPTLGLRGAMYASLVGAGLQTIIYGHLCWRKS
jgi:O-antigen/teichoic acid export membrane protein